MIQDFVVRKQTPDNANNWLYFGEGFGRVFKKEVYLPDTAPAWAECTNEEKEQWEQEHPAPEVDNN